MRDCEEVAHLPVVPFWANIFFKSAVPAIITTPREQEQSNHRYTRAVQ
uniref:Uncharacterized protein n=1 Tax=Anguilla anguilla TaxID=7936 RepID=A0A0E9WGN9_ANGAN